MEILLLLPGFILAIMIVVIYEIKLRKSQNNVHFYVARDKDGLLWLYLGKPVRKDAAFDCNIHGKILASASGCYFGYYGLNVNDYKNLKWEDEPVEVFLNLED